MSVVQYNTVTLPYAETIDFRQSAVYDDQGGVDRYLTKFDITVQSVLNVNYVRLLSPNLNAAGVESAADIMVAIRTLLMRPRRTFSMSFNGSQLLPAIQDGITGTVDAKNGPQPQSCNLHQLTNTTFLLTYRIIAHYWEVPEGTPGSGGGGNAPGGDVLFNRWAETVDIDFKNRTTKTRQGKVVIRSDNVDGLTPDHFRSQMCVVGVPDGFLRESSQYSVTPDGLAIEYRVIDKEYFKPPPHDGVVGAFKADGEYLETSTNLGAVRFGQSRVHLIGDNITNQTDLANLAIAVGMSKLNVRGATLDPMNGSLKQIVQASLRMDMWENEVEFVVRGMFQGADRAIQGIAAFVGLSSDTPGSDDTAFQPNYFDRGTAGVLLQAAAYYDPALKNAGLGAGEPWANTNPLSPNNTSANSHTQLNTGGQLPGTAGKNKEP
jgi:hypothetical protein